jgi:hypothetical protein
VSALHKELVGKKVLNSGFAISQKGRQAHIYTHCAKRSSATGGITLFGVNYASEPLMAHLHGVSNNEIEFYALTADEKGPFSKYF